MATCHAIRKYDKPPLDTLRIPVGVLHALSGHLIEIIIKVRRGTPMDQRHLNSYIHKIVELLKTQDRSFSFREIEASLGINVSTNSALTTALRNNSKIVMGQDMLRFVPAYNIRSVEDLRAVLAEAEGREGIEMSKLLESPIDVRAFVSALQAEGVLIILKDLDGAEILFYNSQPLEEPVNPEIRALWESVKIPNYHDIVEELNMAGLKSTHGQVVKKRVVIKSKPKKRSQRRIKVTNTHVEGLDLTGMNDSE